MRWRMTVTTMLVAGLAAAGCGDGDESGRTADTAPIASAASPSPTQEVTTTTTADPPTTSTTPPPTTVSTTADPPTTATTTTTAATTATTTTAEPPAGLEAELTFTVVAPSGEETIVSIDCPDDTDTACQRLTVDDVRVRLIDGPPRDRACTMQFGSAHRARAIGTLDGIPVDTTFARNDGCAIADWDVLMAGILPPASDS
ncbi:MAG: hypothetical protein AAGA93_17455 [Actinomycetota bacterium]